MDQQLFKLLTQTEIRCSLVRMNPEGPFTHLFHPTPLEIRKTIRVLERICKNLSGTSRLDRQLKQSSVAAIFVSNSPNEEIFLSLSRKRIPSLIESYYLITRHPELAVRLLVDNQHISEGNFETSISKIENLSEVERVLMNIVLEITCKIGPRGLGGRERQTSLENLRVVRKRPLRARKKVFRRGYADKGSTAPEHVKVRRQSETEHYRYLAELVGAAEHMFRKNKARVRGVQTITGEVLLLLDYLQPDQETFSIIQSERRLLEEKIDEYIKFNSLEVKEIGQILTKLFDLG